MISNNKVPISLLNEHSLLHYMLEWFLEMQLQLSITLRTRESRAQNRSLYLVLCGDYGKQYVNLRKYKSVIGLSYVFKIVSIKNMPANDIALSRKYGKIVGCFDGTMPNLFITDVELIKSIFVKDFDHFVDRRVYFSIQ